MSNQGTVDYATLHDFLFYFVAISFLLLGLVLILVVSEVVKMVRKWLRLKPAWLGGANAEGDVPAPARVDVKLSYSDHLVLEALSEKVSLLSVEVTRIRAVFEKGPNVARDDSAKIEANPSPKINLKSENADTAPTTRASTDEALESMRLLYNAAVDDKQQREIFREKYRPEELGVTNSDARLRSPKVPPLFDLIDGGNYLAIPLDGRSRFAVIPRHALTVRESNYSAGAMGEVFHCPGYRANLRYGRVKVVKPAMFELEGGKVWRLRAKGELDLGRAQ